MTTYNTQLSKKQLAIAKVWITSYINNDWLAIYKALKMAQMNASEDGLTTEVLAIEGCRTFCLELHLKKDEVTALEQIKELVSVMSFDDYRDDLKECKKCDQETNSIEAIELFRDLFANLQLGGATDTK